MNVYNLTLTEICQEREDSYMSFPELRAYMDSYQFCSSNGGEMATPSSTLQLEELKNATKYYFEEQVSKIAHTLILLCNLYLIPSDLSEV